VLPVFADEAVSPTDASRSPDARACVFPSSLFPELGTKMPELTQRPGGNDVRPDSRNHPGWSQQRDRLASFGKLSAGLAHELNNPASAARPRHSQLREVLKRIRDGQSHELGSRT